MDLSPVDKAASGNWFNNAEQFEMCLNALLHHMYWPMERNEWTEGEQIELDLLTDDGTNRASLSRFRTDGVDGSFPQKRFGTVKKRGNCRNKSFDCRRERKSHFTQQPERFSSDFY